MANCHVVDAVQRPGPCRSHKGNRDVARGEGEPLPGTRHRRGAKPQRRQVVVVVRLDGHGHLPRRVGIVQVTPGRAHGHDRRAIFDGRHADHAPVTSLPVDRRGLERQQSVDGHLRLAHELLAATRHRNAGIERLEVERGRPRAHAEHDMAPRNGLDARGVAQGPWCKAQVRRRRDDDRHIGNAGRAACGGQCGTLHGGRAPPRDGPRPEHRRRTEALQGAATWQQRGERDGRR